MKNKRIACSECSTRTATAKDCLCDICREKDSAASRVELSPAGQKIMEGFGPSYQELQTRCKALEEKVQEHERYLRDTRGYLKFCALNDISAEEQLSTIGHDIYGLTEKKLCFLPRVHGCEKHLFV